MHEQQWRNASEVRHHGAIQQSAIFCGANVAKLMVEGAAEREKVSNRKNERVSRSCATNSGFATQNFNDRHSLTPAILRCDLSLPLCEHQNKSWHHDGGFLLSFFVPPATESSAAHIAALLQAAAFKPSSNRSLLRRFYVEFCTKPSTSQSLKISTHSIVLILSQFLRQDFSHCVNKRQPTKYRHHYGHTSTEAFRALSLSQRSPPARSLFAAAVRVSKRRGVAPPCCAHSLVSSRLEEATTTHLPLLSLSLSFVAVVPVQPAPASPACLATLSESCFTRGEEADAMEIQSMSDRPSVPRLVSPTASRAGGFFHGARAGAGDWTPCDAASGECLADRVCLTTATLTAPRVWEDAAFARSDDCLADCVCLTMATLTAPRAGGCSSSHYAISARPSVIFFLTIVVVLPTPRAVSPFSARSTACASCGAPTASRAEDFPLLGGVGDCRSRDCAPHPVIAWSTACLAMATPTAPRAGGC